MIVRRHCASWILVLALPLLAWGTALAEKPIVGPGDRVVFLGDSITAAGHYVSYVEAHLRLQIKGDPVEVINLGLPSEGCTGLSEPDHPFPRPNVHERLARALEKTRPDVVVACYGMNDGIYYPFSEDRFAKYRIGIDTLIVKVSEHGAKLILLTPPPFDPVPLKKKGNLLPADAKEFSWMKIYEHYDRDVIARYAQWLLNERSTAAHLIDLHAPITEFVTTKRKDDPDFVLSGDGVHLNKDGHRLIADAIHQALYEKPLPEIPPATLNLVAKQQQIMHASWLSHVGHKRPGMKAGLPLEEARSKAAALAEK